MFKIFNRYREDESEVFFLLEVVEDISEYLIK